MAGGWPGADAAVGSAMSVGASGGLMSTALRFGPSGASAFAGT